MFIIVGGEKGRAGEDKEGVSRKGEFRKMGKGRKEPVAQRHYMVRGSLALLL